MSKPLSTRSARAWAAFKTRVEELGGRVIEEMWLGSNSAHRVVCAKGHAGRAYPGYVAQGGGICGACRGYDPHGNMARFRERVEELGGRVVEDEWLGARAPHRVVCAAGHECQPRPHDVRRGRGICGACGGKDPAVNLRRFRERVEELGGRVVEERWLGGDKPHRVVCGEGHEVDPQPRHVLRGGGICRTCSRKDPEDAWRRFRERVEELGGRVVEEQWLGSNTPHQAICAAGHECQPRPHDVRRGRGICGACVGKSPAVNLQRFRERVEELGGRVVEEAWLGANTPHRVVCGAGHASRPRPTHLQQGRGICVVCAGKDPETAWEKFRAQIEALGGRVTEPGWLGSDAPHRVLCGEGHPCRPRPSNVSAGQGICRTCAAQDPEDAWRRFRERVEELGGRVVEEQWLGSNTPHRVVCAAGHERRPTPSSVLSGGGICRICAWSSSDAFYIVEHTSGATFKLGITTGNGRLRLWQHRRNGYDVVLKFVPGLADAAALEAHALKTLEAAGVKPVKGREYFPRDGLAVVLDVVDGWVSAA